MGNSVVLGPYVKCGHPYGCGCVHWDGCCTLCPLPECSKTGIPNRNGRKVLTAPRNAAIVRAWRTGVPVERISERFQLGERRVYNVLAQARRGAARRPGRVRAA